jgi:hypothetical protein
MKITFKVYTTTVCGYDSSIANIDAGSQAEQVRHRGRAFGNGAQTATPRQHRDRQLTHTLDWRAQVEDSGREGLGSSSAEADLLR